MKKKVSVNEGDVFMGEVSCKECPETWDTVYFDVGKWHEIQAIMDKMGNMEFSVYLIGHDKYVTDYYIPEQIVEPAHVTVTEMKLPDVEIVGHYHSHHSMGAFHSGEDRDHANWPIHITGSTKGYACMTRVKTSCGQWLVRENVKIVLTGFNVPNTDKIKIAPPKSPMYKKFEDESKPIKIDNDIYNVDRKTAREIRREGLNELDDDEWRYYPDWDNPEQYA